MFRLIYERMSRANDGYSRFMERIANVDTFGSLIFSICLFGACWAFAWYAHIIGPWVDSVMGWGPHDIDSMGKISWRRMWSTSICLPGILVSIALYVRNRRKRRN